MEKKYRSPKRYAAHDRYAWIRRNIISQHALIFPWDDLTTHLQLHPGSSCPSVVAFSERLWLLSLANLANKGKAVATRRLRIQPLPMSGGRSSSSLSICGANFGTLKWLDFASTSSALSSGLNCSRMAFAKSSPLPNYSTYYHITVSPMACGTNPACIMTVHDDARASRRHHETYTPQRAPP